MINKMNIAFIASTLALLSTLYSCKKETTTNSELTVGPLELVAESLTVSGAKFKVAINDPAGIAGKKRLCWSSTVQLPTIDTAGNAIDKLAVLTTTITDPSVAVALQNFNMGTNYYVRAAVVTKSGAIVYSNVVTIKTPTITAGTLKVVGEIGFEGVILSAAAGSSGVIEGSVYYSTTSKPTAMGQLIQSGGQAQLKDLTPGATYYARIGVTTFSGEVIYGPEISFTIRPCVIGAEYKGGIIFYIDNTKAHGLIAAKEDIGESAPNTEPDKKIFKWGLYGTAFDCLDEDGLKNTKNIISRINDVAISNQTAAGQCVQYRPSGSDVFQTDWYLPSLAEWKILNNVPNIPNIKDEYWTSSGQASNPAWRVKLTETEPSKRYYLYSRDEKTRVRAIHKF